MYNRINFFDRIQIHFTLQTHLKVTLFVLPYRGKGYKLHPQRLKNLLQNRIKTNLCRMWEENRGKFN